MVRSALSLKPFCLLLALAALAAAQDSPPQAGTQKTRTERSNTEKAGTATTVRRQPRDASPANPRAYPPQLPEAREEVYKQVGDTSLRLYIFEPKQKRQPAAAIVFFFGGGWQNGSPQQFAKQCEHFASRGMVAITADYRVASRHGVKAVECVKDAKSALRWIRMNAERLGIDPNRLVAAGGSAGGHIAACSATISEIEPDGEDHRVSSAPNALVLFNPAMSLVTSDGPLAERLNERLGVSPEVISPAHHVRAGLPPTIMFFGSEDRLLAGAEDFCRQSRKEGNRCEIQTWVGKDHGFFNYGRDRNVPYTETVQAADKFLQSLGYLDPE